MRGGNGGMVEWWDDGMEGPADILPDGVRRAERRRMEPAKTQ